jgi:DNA-binding XRE family transcriptional regulator
MKVITSRECSYKVDKAELAKMFGVTKGTIYHIARGFTWKHIKLKEA